MIELLAVIVIIGILTLLAIPLITKYINISRQKLFAENAIRAVESVKNYELKQDYLSGSEETIEVSCTDRSCNYTLDQINAILEKKLITSPFGGGYNKEISSIISEKVLVNGKEHQAYQICLIDEDQNGFGFLLLDEIDYKKVQLGVVTSCGYGANGVWADQVSYSHEGLSYTNVQEMIDYLASLLR